jgi:hypothetical protein
MEVLRAINRLLLKWLPVEEDAIALDSTGFELTQASSYYLTRHNTTRQTYIRGVFSVGTCSQMILGWRTGFGPGADMGYLNPMRREAHAYGRMVRGQRWKCETVHSVMKRFTGSFVLSRKPLHQRREVVLKALAYNIHR